ncbi:MAG: hypothetical protein IKW28_10675 [Lachnospiraceae bacterium]|nr:hypothetical protein [Lachnospiraceae bacterium]
MNKSVLGIDLGTSSVKILQIFQDHSKLKFKEEYKEKNRKGWWDAILSIFDEINFDTVEAIGLSSQVGTYLINQDKIIHWNQPEGKEQLERILKKYEKETFLKELGLNHPKLNSYPIPRLLYCSEAFSDVKYICQPKDYICEMLTGKRVSDPYSWRGLAEKESMEYSAYFLEEIKIKKNQLPEIKSFDKVAGYTKEIDLKNNKVRPGIPVYTGLNDFFASLAGMGITDEKTLFDITGTSEHLGIITKTYESSTGLIASPYLENYIHYGVTASAGDSIKMALRLGMEKLDLEKEYPLKSPIFLPYLNGERAPIFDPDARGCFFGIGQEAEKLFPYSVLEGIVFSLYHIYENLGMPPMERILLSGGAGDLKFLNELKAEIFGVRVEILEETETSALGAALIAAVGSGWYPDLKEAQKDRCKRKSIIKPGYGWKGKLESRYEIYKKLYPLLKELYQEFKEKTK